MRAISLWQPWASLIACGAKPYETRDYPPPADWIGARIAIHAARMPVSRALKLSDLDDDDEFKGAVAHALRKEDWATSLPYGAVICTALLVGAYQLGSDWSLGGKRGVFLQARGSPHCDYIDVDLFGNYAPLRWVYHLRDVQEINPPAPARGFQKFWTWAEAA